MQKYKVSIPVVLAAGVDAIAVRFPKSFNVDSVKAKVLLTNGNPRGLSVSLDRQKAQKFVLGSQKMGLDGVGAPPFSETTEHLAT